MLWINRLIYSTLLARGVCLTFLLVCYVMCTCYEVSIVQCVSCTFCSLLQTSPHSSTTQCNNTQHYAASHSITQHHAASRSITHYHTKDQYTKLHHQYQTQCILHSKHKVLPSPAFVLFVNITYCCAGFTWMCTNGCWMIGKKRENKKNVLQPVLKILSSAGK